MFQKILKVLGKRLWWNRLLESNINFYFKTKRFTFRQKHVSDLIQRRLDYFYISNSMQFSVKNTDVLASLFTHQLYSHILKMKKVIEVEAFGNLITA